ncbi:hypothetical protein V2G26_017936 [Clonostachys chloroleuca]
MILSIGGLIVLVFCVESQMSWRASNMLLLSTSRAKLRVQACRNRDPTRDRGPSYSWANGFIGNKSRSNDGNSQPLLAHPWVTQLNMLYAFHYYRACKDLSCGDIADFVCNLWGQRPVGADYVQYSAKRNSNAGKPLSSCHCMIGSV